MFRGLSAFPLTPFKDEQIDLAALAVLVQRLVASGVDSLGILGSTGSYAYLDKPQRKAVLREAIRHAGTVPVIAGVGALRTRDALELALDAQQAGAAGLLLAPVSYQPLNDDEVFALYETVCRAVSLPVCVYDNPGTTHFRFSDALHARIAALPHIASIKIPGVPASQADANERVARLRALIPAHVSIGISGDASAARGLNAGCEVWYSVIGGLFPEAAQHITRLALAGQAQQAQAASDRLQPLWTLFDKHGGSIRVVASAAARLGLASEDCLPSPLQTLSGQARTELAAVLAHTQLA